MHVSRLVRRAPAVLALGGLALALAACGSSSPPSGGGSTTAAPTTAARSAPSASSDPTPSGPTPTDPTPSGLAPIADPSPAGTFGTKPEVVVPSGAPPTRLEGADLITGTGATAAAGDTITVQYVGVSYTSRQQFDASWDDNGPISFVLGVGQVIPGWDRGVVGMKAGGRRELVIPPSLAYGANPPTPKIAPDDTLVFVVDLLSVSAG